MRILLASVCFLFLFENSVLTASLWIFLVPLFVSRFIPFICSFSLIFSSIPLSFIFNNIIFWESREVTPRLIPSSID